MRDFAGRSKAVQPAAAWRNWPAQAPDLYAAFMPAHQDSHRFLTPPAPRLPLPIQPEKANSMFDTLMLVAGVAAFALFLGYAALCVNL